MKTSVEVVIISHPCYAFVLCAARCKTSFGCHPQAQTLIPLEAQTHLQVLKLRRQEMMNPQMNTWDTNNAFLSWVADLPRIAHVRTHKVTSGSWDFAISMQHANGHCDTHSLVEL